LSDHVAACDAWIDTGADADDRAFSFPDGRPAGKTNIFANTVNGWLFIGEFVGALTRHGKMPIMWKSWFTVDGHAWSDRYLNKDRFHDDLTVPPVAPGAIGSQYLDRIEDLLGRLQQNELPQVRAAAEQIGAELRAGRKTIVAWSGHMPGNYIGRYDDAIWAVNRELHDNVASQMSGFESMPDDALVLRLGDYGLHRDIQALFARKRQRVLLVCSENPRSEYAITSTPAVRIDSGMAFGDACVFLQGYPISILPPSGAIQAAIYEAIDCEVQAGRVDVK
jgi:hypothetical protein